MKAPKKRLFSIVLKLILLMLAGSLITLTISAIFEDRIFNDLINTAVDKGHQTGISAHNEADEALRGLAKKNLAQLADSRATEVRSAIAEAEAALTITAEFLERVYLRDFYKSWPLFSAIDLPKENTGREPAGAAMVRSKRHNRLVTFNGCSWLAGPDVSPEAISYHLERYQPLSYVTQLLYRQIPHGLWFKFISKDGLLFSYPGTAAGKRPGDPRNLLWYRDAIVMRGIRWTPVQKNPETGALTAICYTPVYAPGQVLIGVAGLEISINDVLARLTTGDTSEIARVMLLDPWGGLTGMEKHEIIDLSWGGLLPAAAPEIDIAASGVKNTPFGTLPGFGTCILEGQKSYIAYSPIPELRWSIAVIAPEAEVLRPAIIMEKRITEGVEATSQIMRAELSRYRTQLLLTRYSIVFTALILAFWLASLMFRPLGMLANVADQISAGDLGARANMKRNDEIGVLGAAMDGMAQNIQHLIAELRNSNRTLERRVQEISHLYEFGMAVTNSLKLDLVCKSAVAIASRSFGVNDVILFTISPESKSLKAQAIHGNAYSRMINLEIPITAELAPYLNGLIVRDEISGKPILDMIDNTCSTLTGRAILCPLLTPGGLTGLLFAGTPGRLRPFRAGDFRLFRGFAVQAGSAVENACLYAEVLDKKRIEHELDIAARIQRDILPQSFPDISGISMAGYNLPALEVGGDFFDVFPMTDGRIGMIIADVSGKGMPAALLMALSRATIRAQVLLSDSPRDVLERTNKLLAADINTGMFITAFFAVYDPASSTLKFSNAGHNPPLLLSGSGQQSLLHIKGIALGVLKDISLGEKVITLNDDDVIVLYTDGITDAMNEKMVPLGIMPIIQCAAEQVSKRPLHILKSIIDRAREYADVNSQFDDITLLILKKCAVPDAQKSEDVKKYRESLKGHEAQAHII